MHRQPLLDLLTVYTPADTHEKSMWQQTLAFVQTYPACFDRSLLIGHITGSAWIVSPDRQQAVLIHHRKLDRWFQPGGHADGDPDIARVARREAEEEVGIQSLRLVSPAIFDIDVHPIPARGDEPEHLHFDIRFLFEGDSDETFIHGTETRDIRWVKLSEMSDYTTSESVIRMVRKINKL